MCGGARTRVADVPLDDTGSLYRGVPPNLDDCAAPARIDGGGAERAEEQRFVSLVELFDLADAVPLRYRAMVLTAGFAGLRQGELFGLRRADIDLLHATVTVRRKRLRLASGEVIEDRPKSDAGHRRVALPKPLVQELSHHLETFVAPAASAYVYTTADGLPIERSNFRSRVWVPATNDVGLTGLRFHDLRHTAGTLAAQTAQQRKRLWPGWGTPAPGRRWSTSTLPRTEIA